MERIPFHVPTIDEADVAAVVETMRSGWITTGPKNREFEAAFGELLGDDLHCVAVNSGTAALHLAVEAAGLGAGDLAITTPFTFTATAEVLRYVGADPLFVDIDPTTLRLEPSDVRERIERLDAAERERLKAILPVHYGGNPCAMEGFEELGEEFSVAILDDAAHALPSKRKGRLIGGWGDICSFSFYVTKTLCTGEGGMAVTRDEALAARMRVMRLHGISDDAFDRYRSKSPGWYYEIVAPGFKYNLGDIAAAMGLSQLPRIEEFRARRERIAGLYNAGFASLESVHTPPQADEGDQHAWHLYPLRIDGGRDRRDRVIQEMSDLGVATSVHFIPLHMQPYWRDRYGLRPDDFPASRDFFEQEISLPLFPSMRDDQVARVVGAVAESLERSNDL